MVPLPATIGSTPRILTDRFARSGAVVRLFEERMRQGIRSAGAPGQAIARNRGEIRRMFDQSHRDRSAAWNRMRQRPAEFIRGVKTCRNPDQDRPVLLPSGCSTACVNRSGECSSSEEEGFHPGAGSNLGSRSVRRVQGTPDRLPCRTGSARVVEGARKPAAPGIRGNTMAFTSDRCGAILCGARRQRHEEPEIRSRL